MTGISNIAIGVDTPSMQFSSKGHNSPSKHAAQALNSLITSKRDTVSAILSDQNNANIVSARQILRNANHGMAMVQTFDAGTASIVDTLHQMRSLVTQSRAGTLSSSQSGMIQKQLKELAAQINDVAAHTTFNGVTLMNHDSVSTQIHLGTGPEIKFQAMDLTFDASTLHSPAALETVMDTIEQAVNNAMGFRGALGSTSSSLIQQMEAAQNNIIAQQSAQNEHMKEIMPGTVRGLNSMIQQNRQFAKSLHDKIAKRLNAHKDVRSLLFD